MCDHIEVFDDHHQGESICTHCGLVLDKLYVGEVGGWGGEEESKYLHKRTKNEKMLDFIKDICANALLPNNIVTPAYNTCRKTKREFGQKKFSDEALAAFSVYNTLHELETPRTPDEIERFSGVSVGKMFEIAGHLNTVKISNDPTRYVDQYCSQLDLEYYDTNIIRVIVGNMFGMGNVRSNSLIATVIRLYCVEKQRKKVKLYQICRVCRVSPASVHRIISLLDEKYVKKITLLYT